MIIAIDNITLLDALFETTSAIATVGLSNGVDVSSLSSISKLVLIFLMYIGRIGVISIAFLFNKKGDNELLKRPVEKILIG
ncbi:MAG: potassium transporter TrkG [Christensenellales bacterium]|jgi:Trk-type K+ transport system membrane component